MNDLDKLSVSPSIVLPNADFDAVVATLEAPAEPVPELVGLFKRARVTPPSGEYREYPAE